MSNTGGSVGGSTSNKLVSIGAAILLSIAWRAADACTPAPSPPELLPALPGEEPRDDAAPGIERLSYEIRRATGTYSASCEDRGSITVFVTPSNWEFVPVVMRWPMRVAYEFRTIEETGRDPNSPTIHSEAIYPISGGDGIYRFSFSWPDSSPARQREIELLLSVTAVDRWGRRGEPCLLTIRHPGGRSGGEIFVGRPVTCE